MPSPGVYITLPSGTTKTIMTQSVTVGLKKINTVNPNANITAGLANVQTQGINNPTYNMKVTFDNNFSPASYLQYTDLLDLAAGVYSGSNKSRLFVYYGKAPNAVLLPAFAKTLTGIPVVFDATTFPLDVSDSKNAYQQSLSLTFMETKDA